MSFMKTDCSLCSQWGTCVCSHSKMSATLERSYQPLQPYGPELGEADETPQDSGVMIHVVPENSRGTISFCCSDVHRKQTHNSWFFFCSVICMLRILRFEIFVIMKIHIMFLIVWSHRWVAAVF